MPWCWLSRDGSHMKKVEKHYVWLSTPVALNSSLCSWKIFVHKVEKVYLKFVVVNVTT